jgi:hypothetical protein
MSEYQVGAYYFPNYHPDDRNALVHGPGWTEWELVKRAEPRFPGHAQPKMPLWGYEDEADPAVMAKKIGAAADHGIGHFLFDWYYYDNGSFLQAALNEGFLRASNNHRLKFALMWANHDWMDIHPAGRYGQPALLYPGAVTRQTFELLIETVVERYFLHPSYWMIDGCPYFSIYELMTLVRGLGGISETREALAAFRDRTRAAGFPDLHLNAVVWGVQVLPNEEAIREPRQMLAALGFDSVASYVWVHHVQLRRFPTTPYEAVARQAAEDWEAADQAFGLPFYPNVTMGWDSSPRTVQSDVYDERRYPFGPVIEGNTPERFKTALLQAKAFLDSRSGPKILSLNAWNEWTEGSYLEPDTVNGMAYLEAVREVFGVRS